MSKSEQDNDAFDDLAAELDGGVDTVTEEASNWVDDIGDIGKGGCMLWITLSVGTVAVAIYQLST